MATLSWSRGNGNWVGSYPPTFLRSGGAVALRDQWIRLALLSGNAGGPHGAFNDGRASHEGNRPSGHLHADEVDEFLNWIFVFGLITMVYSLSRYFSRRHRLAEFQQRNLGERLPRAHARREPPSFLRRIDTWSPAKTYSSVLEEYTPAEGSQQPVGRPPRGAPSPGREEATRVVEIELAERLPPSAPAAEPEKEGLGRFIESGCAICFEEFSPSVLVRVLPCRHIFHRNCLDTWFQRSAMCPLCMHDYSAGPPPSAASGTGEGLSAGDTSAEASLPAYDRPLAFRFFSFPGRLRQNH
ncbi:hypothetical protein cyc_05488 [Cyclospora cayetanensis]|uniref:RING-type domain-containing protein n=1 Tax=Cyclospora cayetanensis TaxID=88456 RepID=A0A1D3D2N7_9EIME|nr:hypothetical protein cyc_05488 [Cyclospora cayetanensis]